MERGPERTAPRACGATGDTDVDDALAVLAAELRGLRAHTVHETSMLELHVMTRIDELLDRRLDSSART